MRFELPERLVLGFPSKANVPVTSAILAGATTKYALGDNFQFYNEELEAGAFTVSIQKIWVSTGVFKFAAFAQNYQASLHCMISGQAKCSGSLDFDLFEGQYGMYYLPRNEKIEVSFQQGYHEALHFEFSKQILSGYIEYSPELNKLYDNLDKCSSEIVQLTPYRINLQIDDQIKKIHRAAAMSVSKPLYYQNRLSDIITQYMQQLQTVPRSRNGITGTSDITDSIKEILEYIQINLDKKINIKQLAKKNCISLSKLEREFKKIHQRSIRSYITNRRIQDAGILLIQTDLPISDIAYRLGFSDIAHFSKAFKQMEKLPPSQYRLIKRENIFAENIQIKES